MHKITHQRAWPLLDVASTRQLEQQAAASLPEHTLMQRAGLATAQLALALAPHARRIWIACGPGNNGGDGLEAALHLQQWGKNPAVTWLGSEASVPVDARQSLLRARAAGVSFVDQIPADLSTTDLCIDALLGIGSTRPMQAAMAHCAQQLNASAAPTLAIDLPSGLHADTGCWASDPAGTPIVGVQAQHTLSLLSLKAGLFTAYGRDASGQVWFDDLGVATAPAQACARLQAGPSVRARAHAAHKGSLGDVAIVGGAPGMRGAALLAGSAALHAGAGRVYLSWLLPPSEPAAGSLPELMFRDWETLPAERLTLVAGCGGGDAIRDVLPRVLAHPQPIVLDADALNALAHDSSLQALLVARGRRGRSTVLTPHPLEAARLHGCSSSDVQRQRLDTARALSQRFGCVVVLKGSGSVVASVDARLVINPTGNARLASPGTGDVLAGMIGAALASGAPAFDASCAAVFRHGQLADAWPAQQSLTAAALAQAATPSI